MKVALFTLVSVVLSKATQSLVDDNLIDDNLIDDKRYDERRLPDSNVELIYMMDNLTVNLINALKNEVSPERWHVTKMTLPLMEKAVKHLDAVLTADEKLQINNEVDSLNVFLIPSGDTTVKEVCDEGFDDTFCVYYNFTSYAEKVTGLAKMTKSLNDNHRLEGVSDEKTKAEILDQLSSVRDEMEQIESAPNYFWEKEPKFEETQESLQNSEKLVSEVAAYLKVKVD
ncbi:hypothetical protein OXX79_002123 [Metschnikowia pulcherrima]